MGLFDGITDAIGDLFGWVFNIPEPEVQRGLLLNKKGTNLPVPRVYGYRRVGGIQYVYSSADKATGNNKVNAHLYMAIVIGEGEIHSFDDVWIDDKHITEFDGSDVSFSTVGSFDSYTDETPIVIRCYPGTDGQTVDAMLDEHPDILSTDRFQGLAYAACRFKVSERLFTREPVINFGVRGLLVEDHRLSPPTKVYTNNAALCMRDLFLVENLRGGKELPPAKINDTDFATAADKCDTTLTVASQENYGSPDTVYTIGGSKYMAWGTAPANATVLPGAKIQNAASSPTKVGTMLSANAGSGILWRGYIVTFEMTTGSDFTTGDTIYFEGDQYSLFACNAVLTVDENNTLFDNVKKIQAGCRGNIPYSGGQYGLTIEEDKASTLDLTAEDMVSQPSVQMPNYQNRYNRVGVRFDNPNINWQEDIAYYPDPGSTEETTFLTEDNQTPLHHEVTLETVTNKYQARDLARILCLLSRANLRCSFIARKRALSAVVGDVITVTYPFYGWSAKKFIVMQMGLLANGDVSLSLAEHTGSIYTYESTGLDLLGDNTDLPNPLAVSPPGTPSLFVVADTQWDREIWYGLSVGYTASDDGYLDQYEIQYKASVSSVWRSIFIREVTTNIIPLDWNFTYEVRVRAINTLGSKSDWSATTSQLIDEDTTPPGLATGITPVGGDRKIVVTFTPPTDLDLRRFYVYLNTVDTQPGSWILDHPALTDEFTIENLQPGTQYYIWMESADDAGNVSAATASVTATTAPINAPTSLTVVSVNQQWWDFSPIYGLNVSYTANPSALLDSYEIQHRVSGSPAGDWISVFTPETAVDINPLDWDVTYDVRVRALSDAGAKSDWTAIETHTLGRDTTAPGLPTGITAVGGFRQITVNFTFPSNSDIRKFEVYTNAVNSIPTNPAFEHDALTDEIVITGLDANATYYIWMKSVDVAGNKSAATASVNATTAQVGDDSDDVRDLGIDTEHLATDAVERDKVLGGDLVEVTFTEDTDFSQSTPTGGTAYTWVDISVTAEGGDGAFIVQVAGDLEVRDWDASTTTYSNYYPWAHATMWIQMKVNAGSWTTISPKAGVLLSPYGQNPLDVIDFHGTAMYIATSDYTGAPTYSEGDTVEFRCQIIWGGGGGSNITLAVDDPIMIVQELNNT